MCRNHGYSKFSIGDAFGAGFEFAFRKRAEYQMVSTEEYAPHPRHRLQPGMYTDDTQMSIALAELLSSDADFNAENLADSFVTCYKRDPIDGYAHRFKDFLDSISSGKEFLDKIIPRSEKNGAAMRSVPLGILPRLDDVIRCAGINARLTHNTPNGIASSIFVALISHYQFHHGRLPSEEEEILPYIDNCIT